jgi:DNA-binding transcriptional MerR regulator
MTASSDNTASGYRIGKVSKLTGISPDTLRVWERRYETVMPQRTPNGGRVYSSEDIARLTLMKKLVDAGDAIGSIASLTQAELEARLLESSQASISIDHGGPVRVVVVGESQPTKMQSAEAELGSLELVAAYPSINAFEQEKTSQDADVIIIEQPSLQAETAIRIADWMTKLNAVHAIVIYRFASEETLNRLPQGKTTAMRAPVEPRTLQQYCVALSARRQEPPSEAADITKLISPAPARRYDDETLARLAGMSPVINCECPKHLAELISSLAAFEQYSNECESRNTSDAELHAYLSNTTSHARHMIENALAIVIEAENLDIKR